VSEKLEYGGELVAVIGTGGRHIAEGDALEHVIGYSIFNDGPVRDFQMETPQWTVGKNFDSTGGLRAVSRHGRRGSGRRLRAAADHATERADRPAG